MKRKKGLIFLIGLITLSTNISLKADVKIISNGKTNISTSIADNNLSEDDQKIMTFANNELKKYLNKMTANQKVNQTENKISLTINPSLITDKKIAKSWIAQYKDCYNIKITDNQIYLSGSNARSVLYAVYQLLEDMGCNFIYPKGDYIPKLGNFILKNRDKKYQSRLPVRGICFYGVGSQSKELSIKMIDWMAKNRYNFLMTPFDRPSDVKPSFSHAIYWREISDSLIKDLQQRGIGVNMSEHSLDYFFPRSLYKKHPEWWAMVNGKRRPTQICYNNKEAVEYYSQQICKFVKEHPEVKIVGTWPHDGGGYCEEEACSKKGSLTLVNAINKIAKDVWKIRKDVIIEHLVYNGNSRNIPLDKFAPNVSALICNSTPKEDMAWRDKLKNCRGTYLFDYYSGDHYRERCNVIIDEKSPFSTINNIIKNGQVGAFSLFLPQQVWWKSAANHYFLNLMYWDASITPKQALKKYCDAIFKENSQLALDVLNAYNEAFYKGKTKVWLANYPMWGGDKNGLSKQNMPKNIKEKIENIPLLIKKVDGAIVKTKSTQQILDLRRLKTYLTFNKLYLDFRIAPGYKGKSTPQRNMARDRCIEYVENLPPELQAVCIDPLYLKHFLK